jgi:prevent-host-death family protein
MAMSQGDAPKRYSIADARDHLARLVHEAERGTRVELTRRGRPVAVVLSLPAYERLTNGQRERPDFWSAYERWRESVDLAELDITPDVFPAPRDRSPGREPPEW